MDNTLTKYHFDDILLSASKSTMLEGEMKMTKTLNRTMPLFLVAALLILSAVPALAIKPDERTTIIDKALEINAETGEFSILYQAILAADPAVLATLDGNGQFTVFAPTDAAFGDLLIELEISEGDLLDDQELVTQVLLYHVLRGSRDSGDIISSDRLRTLQGGFLFQDGGFLTDARGRTAEIIGVNVMADNGIIHVINKVVLP
jgi:uncharacterized surface protein with fasciclin (FAS1) repeats